VRRRGRAAARRRRLRGELLALRLLLPPLRGALHLAARSRLQGELLEAVHQALEVGRARGGLALELRLARGVARLALVGGGLGLGGEGLGGRLFLLLLRAETELIGLFRMMGGSEGFEDVFRI